ncbi:nuclease [Rhynchospora pubera]|uniref:Nuclease n=1 Tax=Rhynchospora pubera TaxID=906938 RepID=A0AAV8D7Z1_9POAL|nr:nuclease [Rhynchospora pubera]
MDSNFDSKDDSKKNDSDSDDEILVQHMQMAGLMLMQQAIRRRDKIRICYLEWKQVQNDRPLSGAAMITNQLQGHPHRCYANYRMSTDVFNTLCNELRSKGLQCNGDVIIEEQVGMLLELLGHATKLRKIAEYFQHSLETVWRCIHNVLDYVVKLSSHYIKQPKSNTPRHSKLADGTQYGLFKDAIGAIDGTHIPAFPNKNDKTKERFRNRKGEFTQNVLAAVDFDGKFLAVVAGWEGSAHDNTVLRSAVQERLLRVPSGKYYLVDAGYANSSQFLAPYRRVCYHLGTFRDRARSQGEYRYDTPQELFNHRHAQLRNVVERTFGVVKNRFHILKDMSQFNFDTQIQIVGACCTLHNFIKHHDASDEMFRVPQGMDGSQHNGVGDDDNSQEEQQQEILTDLPSGTNLREHIKDALWQMRQNR